MDPLATVGNLESRWKKLEPAERDRAEIRIADATEIIASECTKAGVDITAPDISWRLEQVCCAMVRRSMSSPDGEDLTSLQQTAGPYSATYSYANPTGDLYMTRSEKRLLGLNRQRMAAILPTMGVCDGNR